MTRRLACRASGAVTLADPAGYLSSFCETARSYAEISAGAGWARLDLGYAALDLAHDEACLSLRIAASDNGMLASLQAMASAHLSQTLRGDGLDFQWQEPPRKPSRAYREMRLERVTGLTPRMRRFTLRGEDLAPFASAHLHVSLFLPGAAALPRPSIEETGRIIWPGEPPPARAYTLRRVDEAAGLVEIDMLLHPSHGPAPGGDFARDARPGAVIGMAGPGGAALPHARHLLLFGDETALPAIARMLEALPPETRATVRVEVTDRDDELPMPTAARLDLRWLHRGAAPAGDSRLLLGALRNADLGAAGDNRFVWFAAEAGCARAAKSWLRETAGLPPADCSAAGFWRRADSV
jgi:NADPH-dependent ferric siderophore reductase